MEDALRTKNKIVFIDGSLPPPDGNNPLHSTWVRVNGTILCGIRSSVSDDILPSLMKIKTTRKAWKYLKSKFGQGDFIRIADLQGRLATCNQGNQFGRQFYTDLKVLWDELDSYLPIPMCDCPSKTYETVCMYRENGRVIKFLQGLSPNYQMVKTQMLLVDPLPDLDSVYKSSFSWKDR
ncbi:unnamed protein product [Linum trigynum]|uniref:Uncharacterized protein n=1 Tax=Linum trigynum TaxID=586398 RepID=A0AAV2EWU6_9ROSI